MDNPSTESLIASVHRSRRALSTWKTLKLGSHKPMSALCKDIQAEGYNITEPAKQLLKSVAVSPIETEVDLVLITAAELGFKYGTALENFFRETRSVGLAPCMAEVGPLLLLRQRRETELDVYVGMEPFSDCFGCLSVFHLEQQRGNLQLSEKRSYPNLFWCSPHDRWVFVRSE
jgi:hypothetical protein